MSVVPLNPPLSSRRAIQERLVWFFEELSEEIKEGFVDGHITTTYLEMLITEVNQALISALADLERTE